MNRNRVLWVIIGVLIIIAFIEGYFLWQDPMNKPVAQIGNKTITHKQWMDALKQYYGDEVLDALVNYEVVFQTASDLGIDVSEQQVIKEIEAIKEGYSSDEEFATSLGIEIEELKKDIRFNLLLEEIAIQDIYISDPEVEKYYEENLHQFTEQASVYLHEIVVETLEDSERIIDELKNGANFSALAKEQSIDPISSGNGGDLGWVTMDDPSVEEEVIEAAFNLPIGEISEAIPVPQGFAIIQVTDKKDEKILPFAEVREQIRRELALSQVESLPQVLERLKKAKNVVLIDK